MATSTWLLDGWHRFGKAPRPIAEFVPTAVRCILAISATAIGDTLMSTPALRALKKRYPAACLVALLHPKVAPLFRGQPDIDVIVPLAGLWKTAWRLRRLRPDVAVIFHGNEPEATLLATFSGAPFIVKHPHRHPRPQLLSTPEASPGYDPHQEHGIVGRLRLAALLDAPSDDTRMQLDIPDREQADRFLAARGVTANQPCIAFQPGAAKPYKMWPAASFAALAERLLRQDPTLSIVLFGSAKERALCEEIRRSVPELPLLNLAGETPLPLMPALLARMALLVTNDTGTMHLAIATQTPTVSLFVPTEPWGVGPIQDPALHTVIKKPPACSPCITKQCETPSCMEQITVDEVLQAVLAQRERAR